MVKYCSQCGKETFDYVGMCQDCGSLLFQDNKLTLKQKENIKSNEKLYSVIDTIFIYFMLFVLATLFCKFINNNSEKYFIIISLIVFNIFSSLFYFLFYFITHKLNKYAYYAMLAMNIIFNGINNYENNYFIIYLAVMNSILFIALYLEFNNNFTKNDLIDLCFYLMLGTNVWNLIQYTKILFSSRFLNYDLFFVLYCIISAILNIVLIIIITKYLNRNKNVNIFINAYIISINIIIFINIMLTIFLFYYMNNYIKLFINDIGIFVLQSIVFNTGLFLSVSKLGNYKKILKIGVILFILFNIFRIVLFNYEIIYQNSMVLLTFVLSGTILPIITNVISHYLINKFEYKNLKYKYVT